LGANQYQVISAYWVKIINQKWT